MRKILRFSLLILVLCVVVLGVTACNFECEHDYKTTVITPATCTSTGTAKLKCLKCNHEEREEIPVDPDNHTYSREWSKDETHHWYEAVCGHSAKSEVFPHSYATNGLCTVCEEECNHDFDYETVKTPTCSEEGVMNKVCSICGLTGTDPIPVDLDNHVFDDSYYSNAEEHWKISKCVHSVQTQKESHEKGADGKCVICDRNLVCQHDWELVEVYKEATCSSIGWKIVKCTICQAVEAEPIPEDENNHDGYSDEYTFNETHHWKNSTCGHDARTDYGEHEFNENGMCEICLWGCEHKWVAGSFDEVKKVTVYTCSYCNTTQEKMGLANLDTFKTVTTDIPDSQSNEYKYYKYKLTINKNKDGKFVNRQEEKAYYNAGEYNKFTPSNGTDFQYIGGLLPKDIYEMSYSANMEKLPVSSFGLGEFNASNFNQKFYNFIRFIYISTNGKLELAFEYDTSCIYQTKDLCYTIRGRFVVENCVDGLTTTTNLGEFLSQKYVANMSYVEFYAAYSGIKLETTFFTSSDSTVGLSQGEYTWCDATVEIPFLDIEKENNFWAYLLANTQQGINDGMYGY